MADQLLTDTASGLQPDWEIQLPETLSEEAILQLLADKIVLLLARGPEPFFQLMYRLDVSEKKLLAILNDEDVALKVARLVYDRQLQKVKSRQENRMKRDEVDPEFEW